jgi:hypothetical protein
MIITGPSSIYRITSRGTSARARRRLGRHAADCINCGLGIRAMRALVRLIPGIEGSEIIRAPAGIFDRVRSAGVGGAHCDLSSAPGDV